MNDRLTFAEKSGAFTERELELFARARTAISVVPYEDPTGLPVRCHELARAAGRLLDLEVQDGKFGFVEHSWLWTESLHGEKFMDPWSLPNVLDFYVPGSLPSVQLVHMRTGLPTRYTTNPIRDLVVREDLVLWILGKMQDVESVIERIQGGFR